jgi:GTP cyclohydrolase II
MAHQSLSSDRGEPVLTVRDIVEIPVGQDGVPAQFHSFEGAGESGEPVLIAFPATNGSAPLVRLHSECLTGDVFGSQRCDCGRQLNSAIDMLVKEGGYLIYLRQEGRGIGLYAKLDAYRLQDQGLDTFEANRRLGFADDLRDYRVAAAMLKAVGVSEVRLITNNPDKVAQLEAHGVHVRERIGTPVYLTRHNRRYLQAKVTRAKHCIAIDDAVA